MKNIIIDVENIMTEFCDIFDNVEKLSKFSNVKFKLNIFYGF